MQSEPDPEIVPSATQDSGAASEVAYTEALLGHFATRLDLLRRLQTLSQTQAGADQADVNATLKVLAHKQSLLDELAQVGQQMQTYMGDDPDARVWRSEDRRQQCRQVADEGNRLLQELVARDQATLEAATQQRDAVAAQLQAGQDSTLARTAYMADAVLQPSHLDIQDL